MLEVFKKLLRLRNLTLMKSTTQNTCSTDLTQLSQWLFLGQTLADTQGFGTVSADYKRLAKQGWSLDQLLHMSAVRAENSLG